MAICPPRSPNAARKSTNWKGTRAKEKATQLFIETPYRSAALLDALAATLSPETFISVGADLSLPSQLVQTRSARNWRGQADTVKDRLVVFGIGIGA